MDRRTITISVCSVVTAAIIYGWNRSGRTIYAQPLPQVGELYTTTYPAHKLQQQTLYHMRTGRRLASTDEELIRSTVATLARRYTIPQAILGCTLFLQSDLNRFDGVGEQATARGLGRFLAFEVYLLNAKSTSKLSLSPKDTQSDNSLFSAKAATDAAARLLEHTHKRLSSNLDLHTLRYSEDLLWLLSALAYSKGTRSILSVWNSVQQSLGRVGLENALTQRNAFNSVFLDPKHIRRAFDSVWNARAAVHLGDQYANDLTAIENCAVTPPTERNQQTGERT